jgi:hypothetical protein
MKFKPGKKTKDWYLNPVAQLYLMARQLVKILIAGRGFGKSFVNGISVMMKVAALPRSRGLFLGATYTQILTNTLLPMKNAWAMFGYYEGKDYVIGKKPPANWDAPYQKPDRYENVITWWNGTTIVLGSMDRPQLIRGGNYDWVITDEALLVKEDQYAQIVTPTIRGSHILLHGKPGHLAEEFTSSMPYGSLGKWLLIKEKEAAYPENNTFFIEGTSWDNVHILTEKVLMKWKRTLPPLIYQIEVMNKRIAQFGNMFYPSLKDHHFYTNSYEYNYIDNLGYDTSAQKDSRWDKDCDTNSPLAISHDWGAFNCITVDQYSDRPWPINQEFTIPAHTVRFINYMYVSHPRIHTDLAKDFCSYYAHHKNKRVFQYGDKSGNNKMANSKETMFQEFADILRRNGWYVMKQATGDAEHLARHNFINKLHLEEEYPHLPKVMYNVNNCKDLRIALESAPMKDGQKDKSSERNPRIKQEHATHGTDAHDYRLWFGFQRRMGARQYSSEVSFGGRH